MRAVSSGYLRTSIHVGWELGGQEKEKGGKWGGRGGDASGAGKRERGMYGDANGDAKVVEKEDGRYVSVQRV